MPQNNFPELSKYMGFLLQHHLDDFTQENIALAKQFDLPANQVIFSWEQEKTYAFIRWRTEVFLRFFQLPDPVAEAISELHKWKTDTLPQVEGRVLRIDDLTGSYTIRKMILSNLLPRYTSDVGLFRTIIMEFDLFYWAWEKEAFQALFELQHNHLLDAIAERTTELTQKNLELQKRNEDLDNFVYTASHDLKSPVSNIEGLLNCLQDSLQEKKIFDQELAEIIAHLNGSVKRFKATIEDLTEIGQVQKDLAEDWAELELPELVEEVKTMIHQLVAEAQADIQFGPCGRSTLRFSRKNLRSILYNLISNAIKYRSPARKPAIHITLEQEQATYVLSVRDNGLGIKEEYLPRIFGMFQRVHTHVEGTGVGLYLVKRIIENAGGQVLVESKEGTGSSFTLRFRCDPLPAEQQPTAAAG